MFHIINQSGIFGLPLLLTLLAVFYLTIKYGIKLRRTNSEAGSDINIIIYLGIFGLALGLFSTFLGIYEGTKIAARLRPEQLADGVGTALVSLLFGLAIFLFSACSWFILRLRRRNIHRQQVEVS
ncbi:MAG: hypothetical protein WEA56_04940 [Balneolaceae bacterium]